VCRVILAGGLIAPPQKQESADHSSSSLQIKKKKTTSFSNTFPSMLNAAGMRELDGFCLQVAGSAGVPIDVLPGKDDPTTANWPQRPLHSSLLPLSDRFLAGGQQQPDGVGLLQRTPNPYAASMQIPNQKHSGDSSNSNKGNQYVVGTDGRNIQDLVQSLLLEQNEDEETPEDGAAVPSSSSLRPVTELEALEKTLRWGHICPTGPSSVPCQPHSISDPMVLDCQPDLYFCGNSSQFDTTLLEEEEGEKIRLVCVPKFAETGEAVLVNLVTMGVELLRFEE